MKWIGALFSLLFSLTAQAEIITVTPGGSSSSIVSGTTPVTCTSGTTGVLYQASGVVTCGTQFTFNGTNILDTSNSSWQQNVNGVKIWDYNVTNASGISFSNTTLVSSGNFGLGTGNNGLWDPSLGLRVKSTGWYAWAPSNNTTAAPDTTLCRQAAGVVEIGTATSCNALGSLLTTGLTASGTVTFSGLTTGTNADFLCLSAGGVVLVQTSACTISTLAHKPDWKLFEQDAIAVIKRLDVGTFHFDAAIANQRDPNARSLQIGLNAENVARIVPEAAVYEDDMRTPKSYRQEGLIALLVKAFQQQQRRIEELESR